MTTETITLREFVILSGIVGTSDLVRASQWVGVGREPSSLPTPILSRLSRPPEPETTRALEQYVHEWTRLLQAAATSPRAGTRTSRKLDRIQREAYSASEAALASLVGTAWLGAQLELDDSLDAPEEVQIEAARRIVRSGIQEWVARAEMAPLIETWVARDALPLGVAMAKVGNLSALIAGPRLRTPVGLAPTPLLGAAITEPIVDLLGRPGFIHLAGRHESFYEGAHDVLCLAAQCGRPELLQAAARVLSCGAAWAYALGDLDAQRHLHGRLDTFCALYFPDPEEPDSNAFREAAHQFAVRWDDPEASLLQAPLALEVPADHLLPSSPWAAHLPEVYATLARDPQSTAAGLQQFAAEIEDAHPALPSALLAIGQLGLSAERATARPYGLAQTNSAAEFCRIALDRAPASAGYPELARRWLMRRAI